MAFGLTPQGLDDNMTMDEWLRQRNQQLDGDPSVGGADQGEAEFNAPGPGQPMPFSTPDPDAGPWADMVARNQALQAQNDPLARGARPNTPMDGVTNLLNSGGLEPADWQALRNHQLSGGPGAGAIAAPAQLSTPQGGSRRGMSIGEAMQDQLDTQRNVDRATAYTLYGQRPETPTADNPVARWAESRVGTSGYDRLQTAPDAKGRLDDIKAMVGRRGAGDPKCNQFVYDALTANGAPPGRLDGGRIPVAKDWGDPASKIAGYQPVSGAPQPGEVISNGQHVGIYAPLPGGRPGTVSAASPFTPDAGWSGGVVHNGWGFRGDEGKITIWRPSPPAVARS